MLRFLGTGSAFHTKLGNNSGYFKEDGNMVLFDCGGTVFCKLQQGELLDDVAHMHVVITHTHPDHIGSLGDLVFYMYYIKHIKLHVYFPIAQIMEVYLAAIGVGSEMYHLHDSETSVIGNQDKCRQELRFVSVKHVDSIPAFGVIFHSEKESFYYSGDTSAISDEILEAFKAGDIQTIYQDTCGADYEGNVHMSFRKLCERIPEQFRKRVYCMHLDRQISIDELLHSGFSVAVNIFDINESTV